ncbi:MAG: hypothetical protein AVO38_00055 [delta proteobacterium ML8_D]|jgi:hypothetical protein|nr:MAG: hypothetical protein AVO38_00055 [delta proteobacterium ML8_D]
MEEIKNFFTSENLKSFFVNIYSWLEDILTKAFDKIEYEPIRNLLINPWFWIIIVFLFLLSFLFRRR